MCLGMYVPLLATASQTSRYIFYVLMLPGLGAGQDQLLQKHTTLAGSARLSPRVVHVDYLGMMQ